MGVIKKNDSKVGLFNSPSEESLHIPQSSEDECSIASQDEHVPTHDIRRNRRRFPVPMYFHNARKRLGKKKSRHHENVTHLMTLVEEEELGEITIYDLVPDSEGGFTKIFKDESAYQVWDEFINSSDEVQSQILEANNLRPISKEKQTLLDQQLTGEQAFKNIKSGIRNKLKKTRVPQGMLDYLEKTLVEFFTLDPRRTYISESISGFERLMLHAISQYHRLVSHSIDSEPDKIRLVHVYNPYNDDFKLPTVLLGQYLEQRRRPTEVSAPKK